ncbi:hypothetical protein CKO11_13850 [Rhodobacter sp. TJ_12]|uniref:FkbM family methyltransferase n=1 Tax=Rhodobacter sp. TJ_12 TaxID=2029399 RepID=UPI001CBF5EDA|nr:FkbM family methyltransferase [Rhodobacter sp. TJ_12]MBZ4023541.1 hypothetical protein [Rhodobacter sp. TJ_12]
MFDTASFLKGLVSTATELPHVTLGTKYGAWEIPEFALESCKTVYSFGAGTDISFDVAVAHRYGLTVHIFDPTPGAKKFYDRVVKNIHSASPEGIIRAEHEQHWYRVPVSVLDKLHFHEIGIWDADDVVKFYSPQNEAHISHSIVNLQRTETYFEANVRRLSTIVADIGVSPDIIKIDIEGAEYTVLADFSKQDIRPLVFCIEFDELNHPMDDNWPDRITQAVNSLTNLGYVCTYATDDGLCFVRKEGLPA